MKNDIETVVFDLDGTVYQNTVFHRDYLHFLVEGTRYEGWHTQLVEFAEQVYAGRRLQMNCFYSPKRLACQTPEAFFCALEQCLCPPLTFTGPCPRPPRGRRPWSPLGTTRLTT